MSAGARMGVMFHGFPARFPFVASMNPCHCGHFGLPDRLCNCGLHQVQRYSGPVSRPILDRIGIQEEVGA